MTNAEAVLMHRAGALLLDAAGMLRMEAVEWRSRKGCPTPQWDKTAWDERCERIATTNDAAANAMSEHAKKIAETVTATAA